MSFFIEFLSKIAMGVWQIGEKWLRSRIVLKESYQATPKLGQPFRHLYFHKSAKIRPISLGNLVSEIVMAPFCRAVST